MGIGRGLRFALSIGVRFLEASKMDMVKCELWQSVAAPGAHRRRYSDARSSIVDKRPPPLKSRQFPPIPAKRAQV